MEQDPRRRTLAREPLNGPHDLVFASRTGAGLDHRNVGGRILSRAVEAAGLGPVLDRQGNVVEPAPTFHALRHSHASALVAAGFDVAEVSARLGHADVATTLRIYVHQFDAARRSSDLRNRLAAMEASVEAEGGNTGQQTGETQSAEVLSLPA